VTENFVINKTLSKQEVYETLMPQLNSLINSEEPTVTNISNIIAALNEAFEQISWIGFYILNRDKLYLGPFQGKVACTVIDLGDGVCGTAAKNKETIIVDDVNKFPGHIVCDSGSKSEIVVPIFHKSELIAVLDLDSYSYSTFDNVDKDYLERICKTIGEHFDLTVLISN
jgi:L-methionine (R)-S-oxide reductase